ncbi:MAG: type III-A CRISPR-associated RAMP protein Csm3 [Deltaproteobacteria bacterium]|nr:type III-A CRISPR-associated RAMP protein Csm3 [Deltaproteobacteria bacterium]MBW1927835.1 type III-A CRISPR-associated RAMP protein Csm3 [Deltaproteobacteria bacterium]MBW2026509.1 type III-A CRISPR-associated RAMP protein Csm3 [Deltaproteobacteria bacterium]MBW2126756.1 type III-A CRISPR-associated RAMP protein Csm3 [Deltaproteobacteria bacterium]
MQLVRMKQIKGKIFLKSGLHIGAGDTEMKIGGTDNTVIKHPHTLEPFIPGSSLKGKIRSLLELRTGLMGKTEGKPLSYKVLDGADESAQAEGLKILKLFGTSGADEEEAKNLGPTRCSFADCPLDENWKQRAQEDHLPFTEIKPENSINRISGTAENPRFTERVPAGAEFRFSVTLKIMDADKDEDLEGLLLEGMKLLEMDALGGNGSRGYGRVQFEFDDPKIQQRFVSIQPLS